MSDDMNLEDIFWRVSLDIFYLIVLHFLAFGKGFFTLEKESGFNPIAQYSKICPPFTKV